MLRKLAVFSLIFVSMGCSKLHWGGSVQSIGSGTSLQKDSGSVKPGAPLLSPATSIIQTSAVLSWVPNTENGSGTPGSYHLIYGKTSALLAPTILSAVTSPYTLTSLLPNTEYFARVEAVNPAGSQVSETITFTTLPALPGVPVLGTPTPSQTSASLQWTAGAGGVTSSFSIRYSIQADLSGATTISNANSPTNISGLTSGVTYYYSVRATNSTGSTDSVIGAFTTLVAAPGIPVIGTITPTQASASISWSPGPGGAPTSYSLKYSNVSSLSGGTTISAVTSPYNLTGLTASTTYFVQITATNAAASTSSTTSTFTTLTPAVGAPVLGAVTGISKNGATLPWSAGSGGTPTSYDLAYATNSALSGATILTGVTSPKSLTGLSPGTAYYYQVTAKLTGSGTASSSASFTTLVASPGAPVLGTIIPAQTSASLAWSAGSGGPVASYSMKYSTSSLLTGATTVTSITSPYILNALNPGTTYYFQITATNTSGSASSSTGSFMTTVQAPGAPILGAVSSITTSGASLPWTVGSGGTPASYNLFYGTDSALATSTTLTGVSSPYAITGLTSNRTYYYKIVALNSAGSASSAIGTFVTLIPAPASPVLSGVSGITDTSAKVAWTIPANTSLTAFQTTLHPVMTNHCSGCHTTVPTQNGTTPHGSLDAAISHNSMYFVDSMSRAKVNFTTPTLSRLYTKVMEGHQCGTSCGSVILNAINAWITQGGGSFGPPATIAVKYATSSATLTTSPTTINNAVSPQAITGLSAGVTIYYKAIATNSGGSTSSSVGNFTTTNSGGGGAPIDYKTELLMGDRRLIYNTLIDLFGVNVTTEGTSGSIANKLHTSIYERAEFGGACDIYASVTLGTSAVENENERCYIGISVTNRPNSNATRYALAAKSCQILVNDSTSLNSFYTKVFGSSTPGAVDDTNLTKAYQLFYPEESLASDVKAALVALGTSQGATDNASKWKLMTLGLCSSPEWQSLH